MSSKPTSRPFILARASTAPLSTSEAASPSPNPPHPPPTAGDPELQWLHDGSCSRPPTPHSRRPRMFRGRSPMRLHSTPAMVSGGDSNFPSPPPPNSNFPLLPSLRAGGSRLGKKFSRRSNTLDHQQLLDAGATAAAADQSAAAAVALRRSSSSKSTMEFDKLESLSNPSSMVVELKNYRQQYSAPSGVPEPPGYRHLSIGNGIAAKPTAEKPSTIGQLNKRRSLSAIGRGSSLNELKTTNHHQHQRPSTNPSMKHSAFLDFFRRSGGGSPLNFAKNQPSSSTNNNGSDFDDLSIYKPIPTAQDSTRKKSDVHAIRTMQPRSPRYATNRGGAGASSLPEIERLIKLSQQNQQQANSSNKKKDAPQNGGGLTSKTKSKSTEDFEAELAKLGIPKLRDGDLY